jgi:hypothetical protein
MSVIHNENAFPVSENAPSMSPAAHKSPLSVKKSPSLHKSPATGKSSGRKPLGEVSLNVKPEGSTTPAKSPILEIVETAIALQDKPDLTDVPNSPPIDAQADRSATRDPPTTGTKRSSTGNRIKDDVQSPYERCVRKLPSMSPHSRVESAVPEGFDLPFPAMDPISDGDDDGEDDESEDTLSSRFAPASAAKSNRGSRRSSVASNFTTSSWGSAIFEDAKRNSCTPARNVSLFADMVESAIGSAKKENANISFDFKSESVNINFCNVESAQKSRRGSAVSRKSDVDVSRKSVASNVTILPERLSDASNITILPDGLTDVGSPDDAIADKENVPVQSARKSIVAFEDDCISEDPRSVKKTPAKKTPAKKGTPRRSSRGALSAKSAKSSCASEKSAGGIFQVGRYKEVVLPELEDSPDPGKECEEHEELEEEAPEPRRWKVKARGRMTSTQFCASKGKLRFMSNFAKSQRAWRAQLEAESEADSEEQRQASQ